MEEFGERKEKEILKRTLSYYNKKGGPLYEAGKASSKIKTTKQYPLWVYVAGVIVIIAIINLLVMSQKMFVFSGGFLVGMLAIYIAMHLYKHK
jgi:hypothetical protein